MLAADLVNGAHVFHGDWLPATGIVGDRQHDQGDAFAAHVSDQRVECLHVHVALERMLQAGLAAFGDDEIDGLGAHELDVRARGIEVRVVGDDVAFLHATLKRMRSAARPWCVGMTWRKPKMSWIESRK